MRRAEREITDRAEIDAIIRKSLVCRLGLADAEGQPYVVPLCFGYEGDTLYFHCAAMGRKLDLVAANPRVCVEFDTDAEIVEGANACAWTIRYRSAIGFGRVTRVEDPDEKLKALRLLMAQYAPGHFAFSERQVERVTIVKVTLDTLTGKQSGY